MPTTVTIVIISIVFFYSLLSALERSAIAYTFFLSLDPFLTLIEHLSYNSSLTYECSLSCHSVPVVYSIVREIPPFLIN